MGTLTSRRFAVGLILTAVGLLVLGTVIPQGLPPSSPAFLTLMALLGVSTGACAWERSRVAWRAYAGPTESAVRRRLDQPEAMLVLLGPRTDEGRILGDVAARLERQGLKVEVADGIVAGRSGAMGLAGSPLFHWSLVLLLVSVAAGALTRSEGTIPLSMGVSKNIERASYQRFRAGPLHQDRTGLELRAEDLELVHLVGRVDVGPSPVVTLTRDSRVIARGRVYPNNPLRAGSMLVHMVDHGLAAKLALESGAGARIAVLEGISDFDPDTATGTSWTEYALSSQVGTEYVARVEVLADKVRSPVTGEWGVLPRKPATPRTQVTVLNAGGSSEVTRAVLSPGQALRLPDGSRLRSEGVDYFARVSVVDDRFVYPVYAFLASAVLGLALALSVPYRSVWVGARATAAGVELAAVARRQRGASVLPEQIGKVLAETAAAFRDGESI